jgi:hypothetical protein
VRDSTQEICQAADWLDGYEHIHAKYGQYGHYQIYEEKGP